MGNPTSPPIIGFWTGSDVTITGGGALAILTASMAPMASIYDYGTIDTGSTGSFVFFYIINNPTGSINVADAILSSSGQTYAGTDQLGLGEHAVNSADHATSGVNPNDMQSGSFTGSVWVRSVFYYIFSGSGGISGSRGSSGSIASAFMNPMSGSSALGSRRLSVVGLTLSGSGDDTAGRSGSAWLVQSYISVLNATPQGIKTGSFCLRYKYT